MAITFIGSIGANSTAGTLTTSSLNTTGATLLVATTSLFNTTTQSPQITDSFSNTWTPLPIQGLSDTVQRTFYCINPTVGTGHIFTLSGSVFGSFSIVAFSGVIAVSPLDVSTGTTASASTIQGGSLTPTNSGSLLVSSLAYRTTGSVSIDSGYTLADTETSGSVVSCAIAYIIETSVVAKNPTWTLPSSMNAGVTNTVFIAGTTAAPTTPAIVTSINFEANGTFTSSAINTTGATLLVANQSAFVTLGSLTDSKSNIWTPLTGHTNGNTVQQLYYVQNPAVGSSHTFTISGIVSGSIQVAAISGVTVSSPFDVEAGGTVTNDGQLGSVTPSGANSIIISAMAYTNSGQMVLGVDTNYKIIQLDPVAGPPSGVIAGALAFVVLPVAAASNPKWFFSNTGMVWAGDNAVFKQALSSVNKTITGKARVQVTTTQTVTGKARVQLVTPKTITGRARLGIKTTQTILGKARILITTVQTITGKARMIVTDLKTITGKARLTITTARTITGKGNIVGVTGQTITGKGRIGLTTTKTLTGKGNITQSTTQFIMGQARLAASTLRTILGKARIFKQSQTSLDRTFHVLADKRSYKILSDVRSFHALSDTRKWKVLE